MVSHDPCLSAAGGELWGPGRRDLAGPEEQRLGGAVPKAATSWKTWLGDRVAQWHSCSPGWLQTQHPAFPPKRGGLETRRAWRWRGRSSAALWSLRCSTPRAVPAPGRPPWPHTPRRTSPPLKAATITHQLCDPKLYSRPSPCLDLSPKARGPTPHRSAPDPPQAFGRREATASTGRPGQSNTGCLPAWTLVSGMSQKPRLLFC